MDDALEAVILAQKTSDAVYDLFLNQIGSTMEQAEIASRDPNIMKQFSMSAGGAVLRFQSKPVMRSDEGAPIKTFLEVNRLDFLLPPKAPDPVKALDIPQETLNLAKAGNQTAKVEIFKRVHGDKPRTQEAESLKKVEALIADTLITPTLDNEMAVVDDRTRRAARAADTETEHTNNPWRLKEGHPQKAALIEAKIKAIGTKACIGLAKAAGAQINGKPL